MSVSSIDEDGVTPGQAQNPFVGCGALDVCRCNEVASTVLDGGDNLSTGEHAIVAKQQLCESLRRVSAEAWPCVCLICGRKEQEEPPEQPRLPICDMCPQFVRNDVKLSMEAYIQNDVCELCDMCFCGCNNFLRVTFGGLSSLERIGARAFQMAIGLQDITIPDNVRELCDRCFCRCTSLRRVTFGALSSLERIGARAFELTDVVELTFPNSVRELCDMCFYYCGHLERVTFGALSSLERIGAKAFEDSFSLGDIAIPDSVRELGDSCFYNNHGMRVVAFGVLSSLEMIGNGAFSRSIVVHILVPDRVRELPDYCFHRCYHLRSLRFGARSSLERIGMSAIMGTSVDELEFPDSLRELHKESVSYCLELSVVKFGLLSSLEYLGHFAFRHSICFREIVIPKSVREVGDGCFQLCVALSRVIFSLPSSLERIGRSAFKCTSVREVSLPFRVRELCDQCFYECKKLERVTFCVPSCLERIGSECFAFSGLVFFEMPSSVRSVGRGAFNGCPLTEDVFCSDGCSFRVRCSLLLDEFCHHCYSCIGSSVEVFVPDSVRELCDGCFCECKGLKSLIFGPSPSVERIGVDSLRGTSIARVVIPDSVRELGCRCFYRCGDLYEVLFSVSSLLERIGSRCFQSSRLRHIFVPSTVTTIGSGAFYLSSLHDGIPDLYGLILCRPSAFRVRNFLLCDKFERICYSAIGVVEWVTVPDFVRELCDRCFYKNDRIMGITFGVSSCLERIGSECFAFSGLVCFEMPASVRSVGGGAFNGCPLTEGFSCSEGCSFRVSCGLLLDEFCHHCYSCIGSPFEVFVPDSVRELCDGCFCKCKSLQRLRFGPSPSVERIGVDSLRGTSIVEAVIPDSVRELGCRCFYGCKHLHDVKFGAMSSLEYIAADVFLGTNLRGRVCGVKSE